MAGLSNFDLATLQGEHQQDRHYLSLLLEEQRRTNQLLTLLVESAGYGERIPPPPQPVQFNWRGKRTDK